MAHYLKNCNEEAKRLVAETGSWIVATVEPRMAWPRILQTVTFGNMEFVLFPNDENECPGIAIRSDSYGLEGDEARRWIMRLCSALSWSEEKGIEIVAWGGGGRPRPIRRLRMPFVTDHLRTEFLPDPEQSENKAALALYREGISTHNPFYSFLSLFKAISISIPDGKERTTWMVRALGELDDHIAIQRRDELASQETEIANYIWERGRNAIAHAEREPFVNPDEIEDHYRLHKDVPLIKNLAELAIEQRMGIERTMTIWREHRYELEGFRRALPQDILEMLEASKPIAGDSEIVFPTQCTVIARRGLQLFAFEDMQCQFIGQTYGGMALEYVSADDAVRIRVVLDFSRNRLQFDPLHGLGFVPNREDKSGLRHEIGLLEFQRCILTNGFLEIWDPKNGTRLGRTEPYIPNNYFVNHEFFESELAKIREQLERLERGPDSEGA